MTVHITITNPIIEEGNTLTATVNFRSGDTANTPTDARYRVDCLTTRTEIVTWTSLTPAESLTISINPNYMVGNSNQWEKKQITVEENTGSTQNRDTITYKVKNNRSFDDS